MRYPLYITVFYIMYAYSLSASQETKRFHKHPHQETRETFSILEEESPIKKACLQNPAEYHCKQLEKFIYCINNFHPNLNKTNPKEFAIHAFCTYHDHRLSFSDFPLWQLNYSIMQIGDSIHLSPEETVKEMTRLGTLVKEKKINT